MLAENHYRLGILFNLLLQFTFVFIIEKKYADSMHEMLISYEDFLTFLFAIDSSALSYARNCYRISIFPKSIAS